MEGAHFEPEALMNSLIDKSLHTADSTAHLAEFMLIASACSEWCRCEGSMHARNKLSRFFVHECPAFNPGRNRSISTMLFRRCVEAGLDISTPHRMKDIVRFFDKYRREVFNLSWAEHSVYADCKDDATVTTLELLTQLQFDGVAMNPIAIITVFTELLRLPGIDWVNMKLNITDCKSYAFFLVLNQCLKARAAAGVSTGLVAELRGILAISDDDPCGVGEHLSSAGIDFHELARILVRYYDLTNMGSIWSLLMSTERYVRPCDLAHFLLVLSDRPQWINDALDMYDICLANSCGFSCVSAILGLTRQTDGPDGRAVWAEYMARVSDVDTAAFIANSHAEVVHEHVMQRVLMADGNEHRAFAIAWMHRRASGGGDGGGDGDEQPCNGDCVHELDAAFLREYNATGFVAVDNLMCDRCASQAAVWRMSVTMVCDRGGELLFGELADIPVGDMWRTVMTEIERLGCAIGDRASDQLVADACANAECVEYCKCVESARNTLQATSPESKLQIIDWMLRMECKRDSVRLVAAMMQLVYDDLAVPSLATWVQLASRYKYHSLITYVLDIFHFEHRASVLYGLMVMHSRLKRTDQVNGMFAHYIVPTDLVAADCKYLAALMLRLVDCDVVAAYIAAQIHRDPSLQGTLAMRVTSACRAAGHSVPHLLARFGLV